MTPYIFAGLNKINRDNYIRLIREPGRDDVIPTIEEIMKVSLEQMRSDVRMSNIVAARQMLCYILRNNFKMKYIDITELINRDRSTIMYSIRTTDDRKNYDAPFKEKFDKVLKKLKLKGDESIRREEMEDK